MRILFAGEYEFFGCKMVERLEKEGHEVVVLTESMKEEKDNGKPKFYNLPYDDVRCEEIFRVYNFQAVIYDNFRSGGKPDHDFFGGLAKLYNLAKVYGIKKFVTIYMKDGTELHTPADFLRDNAVRAGLSYVTPLEKTPLEAVSVCLYNVYGPGCRAGLVGKNFVQHSAAGEYDINGEFAGSFVSTYINDAVEAVYRSFNKGAGGAAYHFIAEGCTLRDYAAAMAEILGQSGRQHEVISQNIVNLSMKEGQLYTKLGAELGWQEKYDLLTGLKQTYEWFQADLNDKYANEAKRQPLWRRYIAVLENIGMFMLLAFGTLYFNNESTIDFHIGLDYSYIYIAVMGMLYGKRHSLPATAASILLLTYTITLRGADLVGLFYQSTHIVHLASYVFVGVFTGYISDNHQRLTEDMSKTMENLLERYEFLENRYLETVDFKDRLYRQIINSDDSIGRVYQIVSKLSEIELEGVFTAANKIAAEIMDTKSVAIYVCGRSPYFLRLKTRSGNTEKLPRSLRIEQFEYLNTIINDKAAFVNRELQPGVPDMAVPVVSGDKVIAVIELYDLPFENFDRQHEILLTVTAMLIADALGRAYRYEAEVQDKKYIPGTRFMQQQEFFNLWETIRRRDAVPPTLLRLDDNRSAEELYMVLEKIVREEDYIGMGCDGRFYMILEDVDEKVAGIIHERIGRAGVATTLVEEAETCMIG